MTVARTICDKASSWCGNRNAMKEAHGVSEVTDIVHLASKRLYARDSRSSCLNTIGMRRLARDRHDSAVSNGWRAEGIIHPREDSASAGTALWPLTNRRSRPMAGNETTPR